MKNAKRTRGSLAALYRSVPRTEKLVFGVLALFALAALVYSAVSGNGLGAAVSLTAGAALLLPRFLEWLFAFRFSSAMRLFIMLFIVLGAVPGTVFGFYNRFAHWDTILHLGCGFLMALVGYLLPDALNRRASSRLTTGYRIFSAFVFALAAAAFWELYEYGADRLLGTDMQASSVIHALHSYLLGASPYEVDSIEDIAQVLVNGTELGLEGYLDIGLIDTMNDILANTAGALVYCVLTVFARKRPAGVLARFLLPRHVRPEPPDTETES